MNVSFEVEDLTAQNSFILLVLVTESSFGIASNAFLFYVLSSKDINLNLLIKVLLMLESVYKGIFSLFNGLKAEFILAPCNSLIFTFLRVAERL